MKLRMIATGLTLALCATSALAQEASPQEKPEQPQQKGETPVTLIMGAKAPNLSVDTWVKGDEVKTLERGKIYVVQFWATWSDPSRDAIPRLTELQAQYKDAGVRILGISCSTFRGETEERVRSYVESAGDEMAYSVGFDADLSMDKAWMKAANARGLPAAFIVDREGFVAYVGNPFDMEETLARVVAGTFDVQREVEMKARRATAESKAQPILDIARNAAAESDWPLVVEQIDKVIEIDPEVMGDWAVTRIQISLTRLGDSKASYAYARRAIETYISDNPDALNSLSWMILTNPDVGQRDLDVALMAGLRANELTVGKNASVLDTLARAYFDRGELDEAVRYAEQAVELADEKEKPGYQMRLEEYKAAAEGEG